MPRMASFSDRLSQHIRLTGIVSDRYGRRTALAINAFSRAWIGLTKYWAPFYLYLLHHSGVLRSCLQRIFFYLCIYYCDRVCGTEIQSSSRRYNVHILLSGDNIAGTDGLDFTQLETLDPRTLSTTATHHLLFLDHA